MLRIKSTIYLTGQVNHNNKKTNNKQITTRGASACAARD
jgi:hypothetical protein